MTTTGNPTTKTRKGLPQTQETEPEGRHQADNPNDHVQSQVDLQIPMTPRKRRFLELYFFSGQNAKRQTPGQGTPPPWSNSTPRIFFNFQNGDRLSLIYLGSPTP